MARFGAALRDPVAWLALMTPLHVDLLAVLDAVIIASRVSYQILGENRELPVDGADRSVDDEKAERLTESLAGDLYARLYSRPDKTVSPRPFDELARRDHLIAVAAANCGKGRWETGWTIKQPDKDGRITITKWGITFWAPSESVRVKEGDFVAGVPCRLRVPHEFRYLVPGFYTALGDGEREADESALGDAPFVRFYWHLTPEAAAPFISATTSLLNATGAFFEVKVLADPNAYNRADAGVLYLRPSHDPRIGEIITAIHSAIADKLRPTVPLFTKRIAQGLGYAENPAGAPSFGQDRCRLVARALSDSYLRGEDDRHARARSLASAFSSRGLDPTRPYLEAGSQDDLPFGLAPLSEASAPDSRCDWKSDVKAVGTKPVPFLDEARRIGDYLCRSAHWDTERRFCNWMGRSAIAEVQRIGGPITPTQAALGPDFYSGSAGVALYLAQLYAITGEVKYRHTAMAAIRRSIRQLELMTTSAHYPPLSAFCGAVGVGYVARTMSSLTGDATLNEIADPILSGVSSWIAQPHLLDVLAGSAGTIPALLSLARSTGMERLRDSAIVLGEELRAAADGNGDTCTWEPERASGPGMATAPLTGMSHGSAGIGLALFELHAATGRLDFLASGRAAFAYEDSLFDSSERNWPDLRSASVEGRFVSGWCHGAPGIALTRLRAAAIDPDRAEAYIEKARIALATTAAAIDVSLGEPKSDSSLCHGLAGLGEVALVASQMLNDQTHRDCAQALAAVMIDRHALECDWPSGSPSRGPNPSFMLGLAGIGYWFLRLHDPVRVPTFLLPFP
jgi:hypothetical protein